MKSRLQAVRRAVIHESTSEWGRLVPTMIIKRKSGTGRPHSEVKICATRILPCTRGCETRKRVVDFRRWMNDNVAWSVSRSHTKVPVSGQELL